MTKTDPYSQQTMQFLQLVDSTVVSILVILSISWYYLTALDPHSNSIIAATITVDNRSLVEVESNIVLGSRAGTQTLQAHTHTIVRLRLDKIISISMVNCMN